MSYKLSITFNTFAELSAFVQTHGAVAIGGTVEAMPKKGNLNADAPAATTAEVAPANTNPTTTIAKPSAKKKEKPAVQEEVSQPVQSGYSAPAHEPVVQQAPVAKPSVVFDLPIDRAASIAQATELVGKLKASGMADDKIMPHIHEVYAQAGCPLNMKISQFDDTQLARFLPLFVVKVDSIVNAKQPAGSFI